MALENYHRDIFAAWRCRLYDDDIAGFISVTFQRMVSGELLKESDYLLFVTRFARDFRNLAEKVQYFIGIHNITSVRRTIILDNRGFVELSLRISEKSDCLNPLSLRDRG